MLLRVELHLQILAQLMVSRSLRRGERSLIRSLIYVHDVGRGRLALGRGLELVVVEGRAGPQAAADPPRDVVDGHHA